jgi:hypothetical protein
MTTAAFAMPGYIGDVNGGSERALPEMMDFDTDAACSNGDRRFSPDSFEDRTARCN